MLKKKLNLAGDQLKTIYKDLEFRAVVDSVPFFDRAFAKEAGLGFVGKNTMLIRPGLGSYFFIASLFLSISADALVASKSANHAIFNLDCGDCRKCMDACPTGAIEDPYFLNATKCLSYLSIEHRGVVKENFLPHFAKTMYGCDICQEVCPYNLKTRDFLEIADITRAHQPLGRISVMDVARMSESEYESWFGGTAMTRAKYAGLVRNALYHLWAVQSESLPEILLHRKSDPHALIAETVAQILSLK